MEFQQGIPMKRLYQGCSVTVPVPDYINASNCSRLGDALGILVPKLFSDDDIKQSSVRDLDQTKVTALIGDGQIRFPFDFFSIFFSFLFFLFFLPSLLFFLFFIFFLCFLSALCSLLFFLFLHFLLSLLSLLCSLLSAFFVLFSFLPFLPLFSLRFLPVLFPLSFL